MTDRHQNVEIFEAAVLYCTVVLRKEYRDVNY